MQTKIYPNKLALGRGAAEQAAGIIRQAIASRGAARVVAANDASQFEFQAALAAAAGIDWKKVETFPLAVTLDEKVDVDQVMREAGRALCARPIDVAFVAIGDNAQLASNDPPADFVTRAPYLVVHLAEGTRPRALSMSVRQILDANQIICVVPDRRKAAAVKASLEGPVWPNVPASILREHPRLTIYLDDESASLLDREFPAERPQSGDFADTPLTPV